jgi:oxygen-independent coproporphyrinogen-3 oxidase
MDDTHTILGAGCGASTKLVKDRIHRHFNYKFPYEYIGQFETMLEKKRKAIEQLAIDNW